MPAHNRPHGLSLRQGMWRIAVTLSLAYVVVATIYIVRSVPDLDKLRIPRAIAVLVGGPVVILLIYKIGFWILDGFGQRGKKG